MNILYICHAKCPSQAEKGSCCPLRGNVKNGWIPYYYFLCTEKLYVIRHRRGRAFKYEHECPHSIISIKFKTEIIKKIN